MNATHKNGGYKMKQSFITLGQGYGDIFEMIELLKFNHLRIEKLLFLHTTLEETPKTSALLVMQPTPESHFQAIYTILEALPYPYPNSNKRIDLLKTCANEHHITIQEFDVKSSHHFYETDLYYQYLLGVLRLQRIIKPML